MSHSFVQLMIDWMSCFSKVASVTVHVREASSTKASMSSLASGHVEAKHKRSQKRRDGKVAAEADLVNFFHLKAGRSL